MPVILDLLLDHLPFVLTGVDLVAAGCVTVHAIRTKKEVRAAIGWVGLAWLAPLIGSALYLLLGINRVARRGARVGRRRNVVNIDQSRFEVGPSLADMDPGPYRLPGLMRVGTALVGTRLLEGNRIEPLMNGDQVYPAMIEAINAAKRSIALSSYIFACDRAGTKVIEALIHAHRRGAAVRVILDGVGGGYFWSRTMVRLRRAGIPVARFLHTYLLWRMPYLNMRTHRKLLIVDGLVGFIGGMNISEKNVLDLLPLHPVRDIHFRINGPVVAHLMAVFVEDWEFSTSERLKGRKWFPPQKSTGESMARGVASGPDKDIEKIQSLISEAIAQARKRILVVTPYFLPDQILMSQLLLASLRGVSIKIVIPKRSNHVLMDWAGAAQHDQILNSRCRLYLSPRPFDHSKIMTVDGQWALIGSSNWDARSFRLNFEHNIESYDAAFVKQLDRIIRHKIAECQELTAAHLEARSFLTKMRDGIARLFLPYL